MNRAVEPTSPGRSAPIMCDKNHATNSLRIECFRVAPLNVMLPSILAFGGIIMLDTPPMTSTPGGKPGMFNLCKLPTLPPPALVAVTATTSSRDPRRAVDLALPFPLLCGACGSFLNPGGVVAVANSGAFRTINNTSLFSTGAEDKLVSSATSRPRHKIRCSDDFTPDFVSTSFFNGEFSSNKSSISSSRKKKAVFHYSRYYFWTTRVRRERERERIRVSQLVVSRFPSRDLRAQNRCVLKRSARLDRRRSENHRHPSARKLRFLSNGLFSFW